MKSAATSLAFRSALGFSSKNGSNTTLWPLSVSSVVAAWPCQVTFAMSPPPNDSTGASARSRLLLHVGLQRRARADQIAVAVRVVHATHRGPELVLARPGRRKGGLLARVL